MEPRPQKPRQPVHQTAPIPAGNQASPHVGPDPSQHAHQAASQQGYDPSAFIAPPRMEYDYSPLDLQPPGQRRKRQIIAGIIGALVVVAIGALIVAGWMALRDDDKDVDTNNTANDRVAELNSTATLPANTTGNDATAAAGTTETAAAPTAVPPTPTSPAATVYNATTIRTALPVVESMPGAFTEEGDLPQDLATVTEALGGTEDVSTMLSNLGWQAAMARTFVSADPATTGTTSIVVSVHAFKDDASAQAALPEFSSILQGYGWTPAEATQFGDGSETLTWTDANSGEDAVTIYVVDGQLLYRVFAIGPSGFDSTENAQYVVQQLVGE